MEICTACQSREKVVDIFVFIPGRDENNIHNTKTLAQLCNECFAAYHADIITLPQEKQALSVYELFIERK